MNIEVKPMRWRANRWRWRTVHGNGRIGVWSEGYHNKADCLASIEAHRRELPTAPIVETKS